MRYVIDNPAVTTAVVGIRTPQQLQDALAAVTTAPLTKNELQALHTIWNGNTYSEHR